MNHKSRLLLFTLGLSLGSSALAGVAGGGRPQPVTPTPVPAQVAPIQRATVPARHLPAKPVQNQNQTQNQNQPVQPSAPQPAGLPAGVTFVREAEGIREYRLNNGLKVLLFPDASAGNFTLNMTYLVGSVQENYGETGMAHLLEHLMFKGTETSGNIMEELGRRGADFNGTTGPDRTNYYESLTNTGDNLAWAIGMEADRMVHSRISGDDLRTEMTVVRNEFEAGENNPIVLTYKELQSVAYDWHNYGNSPIGNRSDVENVPIDRLQAFYRRYYQPDNAAVVLTGNFDEKEALRLIAKDFGAIPKPERTLPPMYTREPAQNGERSLTVRRVGDVQALLTAHHIPSERHPDFPALVVLSELLGDEPSGLLYRRLVQTGEATSAATLLESGSEPGLFVSMVLLDKGADLDKAQAALLDTLEKAAGEPFSEEEVARAKGRIATQFRQLLTQPNEVSFALSEAVASGDWRLMLQGRDAAAKVTAADVQRVAQTYLKPSNRTLARFIPTAQPDRVTVPEAPSAQEVLKDFVGGVALSAGEVLDTAPMALEKRVIRENIGGVKVALLPKDTRGDRIALQLSLDFGNPSAVQAAGEAPAFLAEMLTRGSQNLTRQQLRDRLEAIDTNLNVMGDAKGLTVSMDTDREHLPEALDLLRQVLREPVFPAQEFRELQAQTLTILEAGRSEPTEVATREMGRIFMPEGSKHGDLFYVPTLDEKLADTRAVTAADVQRYYKDVVGASSAQLSVVGDFDPETIRGAVPSILGGWNNAAPYERIVPPLTRPAGQAKTINVPDKANAFYVAGQDFALRDDHPDAAALDVAMRAFGSGTDSRLWNRVRQKEGLSYGVGAVTDVSSRDEQGSLFVYAISNPNVREKLASVMQEEFRRAAKDGFTDAEINSAKAALLEESRSALNTDSTLAATLLKQADLGRTFAFRQEWEARVRAVTPEQAKAAFVKYIHPDDLVIIQAGSF